MKRDLHILQVNTADAGGGAEGSTFNLHVAYRQRGLDAWLAVGKKTRDCNRILRIPNEKSRSWWTRSGRLIQGRLTRTRFLTAKRIAGKLDWLIAPCRKMGVEDFNYPGTWQILNLPPQLPSLVHCHNLHGGYFDLRVLPWLSAQVPVILNLRDDWMFTGHCACSLSCDRWKSGCGKCPDLTIYPAVSRDSTSYNWRRKKSIYDRSRLYITAPSQWTLSRASKIMFEGCVGVQRRVIQNAIDLATFRPSKKELARTRLNLPLTADIVLLTAHNTFKDYDTMVASLAKLRRRDGRDLLFICLGRDGLTISLGQGLISYAGFEWNQERLANFYQAANVFIHASHSEAFGKAITEAMACGTPVVATATGGVPEQIKEGVTGFLVEPTNPEAMAQAVQRILEDGELQLKLGDAAAHHVSKNFGLGRQVDEFIGWYQEVMADWLEWNHKVGSR